MVLEELSFEEFQDGHHGGHLGYQNRTILAIQNLCVTVMLPIKFWLNPTYGLGEDVVWRISRWLPWIWHRLKNFKMATVAAILDIGWNDLSNFESLCHCDASHQVSAQSDFGFGRRCCLKNFKMADSGHLGYRNGTILAILNLCVTVIPPINFSSIGLRV